MTNHPEEEKSSWSQNTRKILRKKTMTANPIIVVFVPNFDESSMSSTWHVKWDPGTRLEFRWNEATESVNFSRTF